MGLVRVLAILILLHIMGDYQMDSELSEFINKAILPRFNYHLASAPSASQSLYGISPIRGPHQQPGLLVSSSEGFRRRIRRRRRLSFLHHSPSSWSSLPFIDLTPSFIAFGSFTG